MTERDSLHRFLFEHLPVRGELVRLDASWRAALERVDYPAPVRNVLGEAMAAAVLLSSTLKFKGALTLQLQGEGALELLVVQCTSDMNLRGLARWRGAIEDERLTTLAGKARLAITIEQTGKTERYQGIVPLEGESLAVSLEAYFNRSEQLPTRLWLTADEQRAAGMLLQILPENQQDHTAWEHATILADTITEAELRELSARELLHRLYHEDDVRLFESTPVAFRCSCSRERIAAMLRDLGHDEVAEVLAERGEVHVECEFCGKAYDFDTVDAERLFAGTDVTPPVPSTRQ